MIGRDAQAYSDQGPEATLLTTIIGRLENKIAIDVGAGQGRSVRSLLASGTEAVYAFEPLPSSMAVLQTSFAETPAVHLFDVALGARDEHVPLYTVEDRAQPADDAVHTLMPFVKTPTRQASGETVVTCRTLDALVAEGAVPAEIGLLKVDAAWSDLAVLMGMGRLFSAVVIVEYWHDLAETIGPAAYQITDVASFMAERHYSNVIVVKRHETFVTLHVNDPHTRPGDRGAAVFVHDSVFPNLSLPIFAVASEAQTQLVERAQRLEVNAQRHMRVIEDLARTPEASSVAARLEILEEQELALEAYCRLTRDDGPWQWVTQQLGVLYQHPPVPFQVPEHYLRVAPLPSPPTISIVTPMLNGAEFIKFTLDSVLDQEYPALEYFIQDGGSTDDALNIVEQYRRRLVQVHSERDTGMAQAINRGFRNATGEIMAYLNADDLLLPGTLQFVSAYFAARPDVDVVYGHRVLIDADHAEVGRWVLPRHDDDILSWTDYVPQESLFWRRAIWDKVGGAMDESFRFAVDWDLLLRFRDAGATFVRLPRFLAAFRVHRNQKTATELTGVGAEEICRIREREAGGPVTPAQIRQHVEPYIRRHKVYHKLYRLGVLAY
jgi:FkbM family methyltransferase